MNTGKIVPCNSILVFTVPGSRQFAVGGSDMRVASSVLNIIMASLDKEYALCALKPFS